MAESYSWLKEGPIHADARSENMKANGVVPLWSPVIKIVATAGDDEAHRCGTTTTAGDNKVYGVSVGPVRSSGNCADAAGDQVRVVPLSSGEKVKVKVNAAIALDLPLETSATAGKAQAQAAIAASPLQADVQKSGKVLGRVDIASAADGDIIVCTLGAGRVV